MDVVRAFFMMLKGKLQSFTIKCNISSSTFVFCSCLYKVEEVPCIFSSLKVLIVNDYCILPNLFFCLHWDDYLAFWRAEILNFDEVQFLNLSFMDHAFDILPNKSLPNLGYKECFLYFLLELLRYVLGFISLIWSWSLYIGQGKEWTFFFFLWVYNYFLSTICSNAYLFFPEFFTN